MSALYALQKLVKKNPHRKALKKLMKMSKQSFREWKKKRSRSSPNTRPTDHLQFWITKSSEGLASIVEDTKESLTDTECKAVQLFLDRDACFCPCPPRQNGHCRDCHRVKDVFKKAKEHELVCAVLSNVFSISRGVPETSVATGQEECGDNSETTAQDNDDIEGNESPEAERDAVRENDDQGEENGVDLDDAGSSAEDEDNGIYNNTTELSGVWVTLRTPRAEKNAQLFDSTLLLLDFLLLQHVAMPYVRRSSMASILNDSNSERTMLSFTERSMKIHNDLISAMESYADPCTSACNGTGSQSNRKTCLCILRLKAATLKANGVDPILGAFCQELLKLKKPMDTAYESLLKSIVAVLKLHMETARKYFRKLEKLSSAQCKEYWRSWSTFQQVGERKRDQAPAENGESQSSPTTLNSRGGPVETKDEDTRDGMPINEELRLAAEELKEAQRSGICFPGRKRCRPCIIFKAKNEAECNKNYKTSKSHSPGLLTVQCCCDSPKLIGFIVMMQAESTALALSAFLSHFQILPRTIYYDNACNLFLSAMLRVPWVMETTRLEVDRFHFKSHKCSSYFDPDLYCELDTHHTETAESINARIEKTLHQARYLKGDHLVPFLRARFSFINLAATFKAMYDKDDSEDEDMTSFFQDTFDCCCERCTELDDS